MCVLYGILGTLSITLDFGGDLTVLGFGAIIVVWFEQHSLGMDVEAGRSFYRLIKTGFGDTK